MKYDHEATKKAKAAAMNTKKTTRKSKKKRKTTAEDLMKLDDSSDSEVALDSLGQFLTILLILILTRMTLGLAKPGKQR